MASGPSDTMRSVALGAGIGLLLLAVGVGSFLLVRESPPETSESSIDSAGSTNPTTSTSTSTTLPAASPEVLDPTTTTAVPPIRDFAELFEISRSAVGSVTAVACDTTRQGTAFLVSDSVMYTSAAVIEEAAEIAVAINGQSIEATVLGRDPERNVAVLELAEPVVDSTPLKFSASAARVGVEVAAIVQPVALPQTLTVGRVASIDETQPASLVRTDADVIIGSSGGPMIDQRGQVVGIVSVSIDDNGIASGPLTAVSGADVAELLAGWVEAPSPPPETFCVGNVDLSEIDAVAGELIAADTDHPQIAALQRTFAVYTQSINSSRAENAFDVLGPAIKDTSDPEAWAEGQRTSKLWDWRIREVNNTTNGLQVRSVFTSTQDGEFGFDGKSTCTRWDITHNLISGTFRGEPYWLINRSRATTGSGPVDCLEWSPERVEREDLIIENDAVQRRTDLLAGGTIHAWNVSVGGVVEPTDPADPDDDEDEAGPVEPGPVTLTVQVETAGGFDPFVEIYNAANELVASNDDVSEDNISSEVSTTVVGGETLTVVVRDVTDRSGGDYSATFTTTAG